MGLVNFPCKGGENEMCRIKTLVNIRIVYFLPLPKRGWSGQKASWIIHCRIPHKEGLTMKLNLTLINNFFAEEVSPCILCSSFVNGERTWAEILFLFFICSIHFNPFTRLGLYYFIQNWSQQTIFLIYCFKIIIVLRLKMNPVNKDGTHLPISVGVHVSFWVEAVAWISPSGTADLSRAGLVGVVLRLLLCGSQGAQACAKGIGLQNEKEMWARLKHH